MPLLSDGFKTKSGDVQAAVFASEDCELTDGVWANTERHKLEEFSTKASMIAAAAINAGSRARSINDLQPSALASAKLAADTGIASEAGGVSAGQRGVSSPLLAQHAAPFHSSALGRDGGGDSGVLAPVSPRGDAVTRGRFDDAVSKNAATSGFTGSEEDTGPEVEAAGCRVTPSPPYDPEITRPQRVTE